MSACFSSTHASHAVVDLEIWVRDLEDDIRRAASRDAGPEWIGHLLDEWIAALAVYRQLCVGAEDR